MSTFTNISCIPDVVNGSENITQACYSVSEAVSKREMLLNISDITLKNNIEKLKEMEKDDFTKKFKAMSADQRRIENLFKSLKIEHYNIAQTKRLYKYDKFEHQLRLKEKRLAELQKHNKTVMGDNEKKDEERALTKEVIDGKKQQNTHITDIRQENEMRDDGIRKSENESVELTEDQITQSILDVEQDSVSLQEETA